MTLTKPTPTLSPEQQARWDALAAKVKGYQEAGCPINFADDIIDGILSYPNVDVLGEYESLAEQMWAQYTKVPF